MMSASGFERERGGAKPKISPWGIARPITPFFASDSEIFSPIFQLYLTNNDHERAVSSLQFDETIGIYVATLLGIPEKLVLVNNRHPMIPLSPIKSGFRLLLHGLSTEVLHGLLKQMKQKQLNFKNAEI